MEIENWLRAVKREENYENPTLDKTRRVMSLIYQLAQRYGLIPCNQESNPLIFVRCKTQSDYEAIILTPEQAFAVLVRLPEPERTLALLCASTGLRISEALGLQWQDVEESLIRVRRTWTWGKVGVPKSKASQAPVPMHPLLFKVRACMEGTDGLRSAGRLGFPIVSTKREAASHLEHARVRLSQTRCR